MVKIEITGLRGEGKTTIAMAIMIALGKYGIECEYEGSSNASEKEVIQQVTDYYNSQGIDALKSLLITPIKVSIVDTCVEE